MAEKSHMRGAIVVLLVAASLTLGACASKPPKPAPAAPSEPSNAAQGSGASEPSAAAVADQEAAGPQAG